MARSSIMQVSLTNSLPRRLSLHTVEQSKRPRHHSVQQRPLWADSREDSHPHQDAQQVLGKGLCRKRSCDRAISLPGLDTTEKELLDPDEDGGDDPLKAQIIRRDVERRVHKHAAFMLMVVERPPDDLGEEGANCLARCQRLAAADAIYDAILDVVIQRPLIERPLIAERVVETGACDPRFLDKIANGSCFVAAGPKALHSSVKHRLFVKFPRP